MLEDRQLVPLFLQKSTVEETLHEDPPSGTYVKTTVLAKMHWFPPIFGGNRTATSSSSVTLGISILFLVCKRGGSSKLFADFHTHELFMDSPNSPPRWTRGPGGLGGRAGRRGGCVRGLVGWVGVDFLYARLQSCCSGAAILWSK